MRTLRAIILAGGYAKRMGQLGDDLPKSLFPVAGRPAIEYILDRLQEVPLVRVLLTTNLRFKSHFESWLTGKEPHNIELVTEQSRSEQEKLGAVGALAQLAMRLEPDDYLVICGDNIFKSSLCGMLSYYQQKRRTVAAVYLQKSLEEVAIGSAVTLGDGNRILSFEEKPKHPKTRLTGACIYMLPFDSLLRTKEYLDQGENRDEPGCFIAWLCKQEEVYAYMFDSYVWDLGTPHGYEETQRAFET